MIDWEATELALRKPQDKVRILDKVVVICERCSKQWGGKKYCYIYDS